MRRYMTGFVLGAACAGLVAAALWPMPRAPDDGTASGRLAQPVPRAPDSAAQTQRTHVDVQADGEPKTAVEPRTVAGGNRGTTATAATPLARLEAAIAGRHWHEAQKEVRRLRGRRPAVIVPRALVERILDPAVSGDIKTRRETAGDAVMGWPEETVVAALLYVRGTPDSLLRPVLGALAARLGWHGGGPRELRYSLAAHPARHLRYTALLIAKGMRPTDAALLESAWRDDDDAGLRKSAQDFLRQRAIKGDGPAREVVGRHALAVFDDAESSSDDRWWWLHCLAWAGEPGLDHAARTVAAGGLRTRDRRTLISALYDAGRFDDLVGPALLDDDVLFDLAQLAATAEEPRASELVAMWPHTSRKSHRGPHYWTDHLPDAMIAVGHADSVIEFAKDGRRRVELRVEMLRPLCENEATRAPALDVAVVLLADSAVTPGLRVKIVDEVSRLLGKDSRHHTRALVLLDRVAKTDPNEWVRAAAKHEVEQAQAAD